MKNSISLFKLHFCPYLCDMLFLVKTLKKKVQSRITKFLFVEIDFSGPINPGIVFICLIYKTKKDNFCMQSSTQNPLKFTFMIIKFFHGILEVENLEIPLT